MQKKKRRNPKVIALWLAVDIAVVIVVFVLLFHKPKAYQPGQYGLTGRDPNQVGQYLPYLASEFYNGSQTEKPFELWITEEPANQAIVGAEWEPQNERAGYWPRHHEGVLFEAPIMACEPNRVTLMGEVELHDAKLVVTIDIVPVFDANARLTLHVDGVKIGALNITPVVRLIARQMYEQRLEQGPVFDDLRTQIVGSLLNDESFDPVFPMDGRWIRLTDIQLAEDRLCLRFAPANQPSSVQ